MCLAIPPPMHQQHGFGRHWWNRVWTSPLRLLGLGAGLQLGGLLVFLGFVPSAERLVLLPLLFAGATLLLGFAMERIPPLLHADAFHYPVYGSVFVLGTAGAIVTLAGLALEQQGMALAGTLAVLLSLGIGGRALWWKVKWSRITVPGVVRTLLAVLGLAGLGGLLAVYTLLIRT